VFTPKSEPVPHPGSAVTFGWRADLIRASRNLRRCCSKDQRHLKRFLTSNPMSDLIIIAVWSARAASGIRKLQCGTGNTHYRK
jgi:hypothetical protein